MKKLAVVALGGNALLRAGQKGTIEEQRQNVHDTCLSVYELIKHDHNLVIAHGNGPQVGNILLQVNAGNKVHGLPEMPLDICGAYSQGFIGYMIEQQLRNVLEENSIDRDVLTLVTEVLVDKNDTAFLNPTKPIGPYYTKEDSEKITAETGAIFMEDAKGNGWRKVVASPKPIDIFNKKSIERLAREGQIIIAVGGGGIPVVQETATKLKGVEAVIDKDLASSLLANQINADEFYILTDVPKVYINYRKENEKALDVITVDEAKALLADGEFGEGSMAPKMRAAISFVENGGAECVITDASQLGKEGVGTRIVANPKGCGCGCGCN